MMVSSSGFFVFTKGNNRHLTSWQILYILVRREIAYSCHYNIFGGSSVVEQLAVKRVPYWAFSSLWRKRESENEVNCGKPTPDIQARESAAKLLKRYVLGLCSVTTISRLHYCQSC